jgi:Cys-tRNA(Pro)/Cys-tRNA(Cys) deacylase
MDPYEEKIRAYIKDHHIQAQHFSFKQSCHSVAEAALVVKASAEDFVKNICMVDSQGELIVAIIKGEDRADRYLVGEILNCAPPRLANPQEILAKTGYPCGGTPSFGYPAIVLVDERVLEKESVFTGGGSETSLIKINTPDLVSASGGRVAKIKK